MARTREHHHQRPATRTRSILSPFPPPLIINQFECIEPVCLPPLYRLLLFHRLPRRFHCQLAAAATSPFLSSHTVPLSPSLLMLITRQARAQLATTTTTTTTILAFYGGLSHCLCLVTFALPFSSTHTRIVHAYMLQVCIYLFHFYFIRH